MTSFEALYSHWPYVGHFRIWGCRAYAHIPDKKRKKLDPNHKEYLIMGYTDTENMFKLYNIVNRTIIKLRDVIFFEYILGHLDISKTACLAPSKNILNQLIEEPASLDNEDPDPNPTALRAQLTTNATELKIPHTFKTAMQPHQSHLWLDSCTTEFAALKRQNTLVLVDPPTNYPVIPHKWVFDIKHDKNDPTKIERFKAHLVAQGNSQSKGVNFDQVYALVIQFVSLHIILHIAAHLYLEIEQGNFVSAFLNGHLDDDNIYMSQPGGFIQSPEKVCYL